MRLNNQEKKLKSRRQNRNLWEWIEIFRNLWRVVFTYVKLSIKFTNGIFSKRAIFVCLPRRKFTFLRGPLVFVLIISWIFSGWPQIWQKPEIPLYPPKFLWNFGLPTEISEKFEWARQGIQEARAA